MQYTALLWADQISKHIEKTLPKEVTEILILGDSLKLSDLKLLEKAKAKVSYDDDLGDKRYAEIFLLGKLAKAGEGIAIFNPLDKVTVEIAKKMNIPVLNLTSSEKPKTVEKAVPTQTAPKQPRKKKELAPVIGSKVTKENLAFYEQAIANSTLKEEDKNFFLEPKNLEAAVNILRTASDKNIGLPFMLDTTFGARGKVICPLLTKLWDKERK